MFSFCTWNVRGLTNDHKRSLLVDDCQRYKLDIIGLQETKCTKPEDIVLQKNYKLIIMDQKICRHGGLGFVISPRMLQFVKSYSYVSDRVAIMDIHIPNKGTGFVKYR